ncbi:hypothetical protein DB347_07840 [Opitutaceae bacterium EW11]|nr:hypothetical protein DB347_07840 [Opitutaceae bacterium EW11]
MKLLRFLLIGGVIFVGLLAVLLALAFTPSVQTWAARRALAGQKDMKGELGRVDVGLQKTELSQLRIERPGMILTVPAATVELPLASAAGKNIQIRRLVAKGWILDLTAPEKPANLTAWDEGIQVATRLAVIGLAQVPAAQAAKPASATSAFEGIFKLLNLPVDLQVDSAELEGDVIFPTKPGQPAGRAHVTLNGGQLAVGKTAQFQLKATAKLSGPDAPVTDLNASGVIEARMDTPRTFLWLTTQLDTAATGPKFPNGAHLKADLKAERAAEGETYTFGLKSMHASTGKQLADVRVSFPYASRQLSGSWKLDAQDSDIAPFTLGMPMPGFVATGEGKFEADPTFAEIHAVGRFETTLERLEVLQAPLAAIGRLQAQGDFDVVQRANVVQVDRFSANVAGVRPIFAVQALQSIELNPTTGELKVADPQKDLFHVSLQGVPLAWVQAFVPDVSFSGDDVRGEFVARAADGGVAVRSVSPLTLGRLTVSQAGKLWVDKVDVSTTLSAAYSPAGWQADIGDLTLSSGGARMVSASLKAGQQAGKDQPIKATGQYDVDLAAAVRQPVLVSLGALTKGRVSGDFTAVVTEPLKQIAAKLEVKDLAAPGVTKPIPTATTNLRADLQADGLIKLQMPLVLQSGDRRSDLDATAELRSSGSQQQIDAQVTSNLLYIEDLQLLAGALQAASQNSGTQTQATPAPLPKPAGKTVSTTPANGPTPEAKPIWSGISGQFRLALKKVVYSPDVQAADVAGTMKVGADAVTLEGVRMNMGEGSGAKLNGGLKFNAKSKTPYALDGDINVANLNAGPILALMNPQGKPTVEGQFDMAGKFSGQAATPDALASQVQADVKLTSRGGKFNGFAAAAQGMNLGKYEKGISTVASIVGLAAGVMGSKTDAVAGLEQGRAIASVVKRFVVIDFDQLNVELKHRPGEETKVSDFSLISPDVRLVGNGSIQDVPNIGWLNRPVHLELQMAVRGDQAKDMQTLGLIKDQKDALGYTPLLEKFPVDGTLSSLGTKAFFSLLTRRLGGQ